MAIASLGLLGTGGAGGLPSSGISLSLSNGLGLSIGQVSMVLIAADNTGTTDADHSQISSVTDSKGNTYTKIAERTNGEGSAAAGVTVSLWMSRVTVALVAGVDTITANFGSSIAERCLIGWGFSVGADLVQAGTTQNTNTDASNDFGSATISGLSSAQRLYVRALAKEANSTATITVSSGFTSFGAARSRNNAAAVICRGEFFINTSTGETSNPSLAVSGDTAGVFVALEETSGGGSFVDNSKHYLQHIGGGVA